MVNNVVVYSTSVLLHCHSSLTKVITVSVVKLLRETWDKLTWLAGFNTESGFKVSTLRPVLLATANITNICIYRSDFAFFFSFFFWWICVPWKWLHVIWPAWFGRPTSLTSYAVATAHQTSYTFAEGSPEVSTDRPISALDHRLFSLYLVR